jgi:hypothetical protein
MKLGFAHNVNVRMKTLKDTILVEKSIFPDANISIAYNDIFSNIFEDISNFQSIKFNEKEHKIGCVDGCILSIKQLLNTDSDIIIFSHDDVRINKEYLSIFNFQIEEMINNNYDIICRKAENFGDYYMMECFFIKKETAIKLFSNLETLKNENEIPVDYRGSYSPEVWLFNLFNNKDLKIKEIKHVNELNNYNLTLGAQLGMQHIKAGERGWIE